MYKLGKLPYPTNALEPYIDAKTMEIHHGKHHATYVEKLNKALEGQDKFEKLSIEELLEGLDNLPNDIKDDVKNNGGGHANHSLFWEIMTPGGTEINESSELSAAIASQFGDMESFREKFAKSALGRFGSGWAWLFVDDGKVGLSDTPNQDSVLSSGKTPILGIDVWEHAYYLKYQNKRADYIEAWWNVVHWKEVEKRFKVAIS